MGIFNRKFESDNYGAEDSPLGTPDAPISPSVKSKTSEVSESIMNHAGSPKRRHPYSIEDAIKLMRTLPKEQRNLVVAVVQQTLSSANINVSDIIDDAERKLTRLEARRNQLSREIEELEAGIHTRRNEIDVITHDAEETSEVKDSLETALQSKSTKDLPPPPHSEDEIRAS